MSVNNSNPQGSQLPKKENDLFKNVVKQYETKQYKKAVKHADAILKKFPNHGETICMKGLTVYYMNKKEEGLALVKQGLMNDMRSHICWHVLGLLHRADRNYNESIKAYKQALRIDAQNMQILRDLSMLQIQMRDWEGFCHTRNTLLDLKPTVKLNWMAFAVGTHMSGDLEGAVKIIDVYLGTLMEGSEELGRCFEASELALYKNSILEEMKDNYQQAMEHLKICEGIAMDRGAWLMKRAEFQLLMQDYGATSQTCMEMFERGMTENYRVHCIYISSLLKAEPPLAKEVMKLKGTQTLATMIPLSAEQCQIIKHAYYTELAPKFPKSVAVLRIPLTVLKGDELYEALRKRCCEDLSRGVPSLRDELASFLWVQTDNGRMVHPKDPLDVRKHVVFQFISSMTDQIIENLETCSKYSSDDETEQPPSSLLWAWYLRAGLHELAAEYENGIALCDKCIEHTPTVVDVYELKGRLLKAAGDIKAASLCVDTGRDLDRQDRYINNLTTEYLLQAGDEKEALDRISMFTKHEGNPEQNLFDMQCSWYELELASCLEKKKKLGRSLKKYTAIVKHFEDIVEDQFDFHSYCLRKVTLRAYVSVLRFEDEVYGHHYYCRAAAGLVRIYIGLHDNPQKELDVEPDYESMSAAERKKAKAIARKKKKAVDKKEASSTCNEESTENTNKKLHEVEKDPEGNGLMKLDPLEEATRYSDMLVRFAPNDVQTWILRYDVAVRRRKATMALQALHKAKAVDPSNSELLSRLVDFSQRDFSLAGVVRQVVESTTPTLWCGFASIRDYVRDLAASISLETPLCQRVALCEAAVRLDLCSAADASRWITDGGMEGRGVTPEMCCQALDALRSLSLLDDEWMAQMQARFPRLDVNRQSM